MTKILMSLLLLTGLLISACDFPAADSQPAGLPYTVRITDGQGNTTSDYDTLVGSGIKVRTNNVTVAVEDSRGALPFSVALNPEFGFVYSPAQLPISQTGRFELQSRTNQLHIYVWNRAQTEIVGKTLVYIYYVSPAPVTVAIKPEILDGVVNEFYTFRASAGGGGAGMCEWRLDGELLAKSTSGLLNTSFGKPGDYVLTVHVTDPSWGEDVGIGTSKIRIKAASGVSPTPSSTVAPRSSPTPMDLGTYTDSSLYYSIPFPKGWKRSETATGQVTFQNEDASGVLILNPIEDISGSFPRTTQQLIQAAKERIPGISGFTTNKWTSMETTGIYRGQRIEYSYIASGASYVGRGIVLLGGAFTFTVLAENEELRVDLGRLLDTCVNGFNAPRIAYGQYTDKTNGVSLKLPTGWVGLVTGQSSPALLLRRGFDVGTLSVDRSDRATSAASLVGATIASLNVRPDFQVIFEGEITMDTGAKGYQKEILLKEWAVPSHLLPYLPEPSDLFPNSSLGISVVGIVRGGDGAILVVSRVIYPLEGTIQVMDPIFMSLSLQ
ncbi:MAG: hypothetical protein AB1597_02855 [Chloroflexota bacterium]